MGRPSARRRQGAKPVAAHRDGVQSGGETLYVAAFEISKVAALPVASLASSTFSANASQHIGVPDGPSGWRLNARQPFVRLFTHRASISVIDTASNRRFRPPGRCSRDSVRGRPGDACLRRQLHIEQRHQRLFLVPHVRGHVDHLGVGSTRDATVDQQQRLRQQTYLTPRFHPMKGPMTTSTLRTAKNGSDTGAATVPAAIGGWSVGKPLSGVVQGVQPCVCCWLDGQRPRWHLPSSAMALKMPPNPVRALDNSVVPAEQAGRDIYFNANNITPAWQLQSPPQS